MTPESRRRHGLRALKARVQLRGLSALDRRTSSARKLVVWRNDLLRDLGGDAAISAQQRALVEAVVRTQLYLEAIDAFIMSLGSLIDKRRLRIRPVVRERQQLVDSLARLLSLLGLGRREPAPADLDAYLEGRYGSVTVPDSPSVPASPGLPSAEGQ